MVTAQYLINNCESHGVIHWKQLRELVNQDRAKWAKKGEYKSWSFQIHKHQNQALLGDSNSSTRIRGANNSRQGNSGGKAPDAFRLAISSRSSSLSQLSSQEIVNNPNFRPCRDNFQINFKEDNK